MKRKYIGYGLMAAGIVLLIIGFVVLPDTVVVQVNFSGEASNTVNKLFGIGLPFLCTEVFGFAYTKQADDGKNQKYAVISAVGVLASLLTIVFNR